MGKPERVPVFYVGVGDKSAGARQLWAHALEERFLGASSSARPLWGGVEASTHVLLRGKGLSRTLNRDKVGAATSGQSLASCRGLALG